MSDEMIARTLVSEVIEAMAAAGFPAPNVISRDAVDGTPRIVGAQWPARKGRRSGRLCVGLQPDGMLSGGFERAHSPVFETRDVAEMVAFLSLEARLGD